MTVDECLQKFAQTGITSFLPSAVATATGLDQETVCQQLRDLVEDGRLKLYQQAICSWCAENLGIFEEEVTVPNVMFCRHCQQNRTVVKAPLLCFPDTQPINNN